MMSIYVFENTNDHYFGARVTSRKERQIKYQKSSSVVSVFAAFLFKSSYFFC